MSKVNSGISMPLACISCDNFTFKARIHDDECPYENESKTQSGACVAHGCDVFGTQLCNSHTYPSEMMRVHPIPNRSEPLIPFQEILV